jgi:hexosaminidase
MVKVSERGSLHDWRFFIAGNCWERQFFKVLRECAWCSIIHGKRAEIFGFMKTLLRSVLTLASCMAVVANAAEPALIPKPEKMTVGEGVFTVGSAAPILADRKSKAAATFLVERLRLVTGYEFPVSKTVQMCGGDIRLTTEGSDASLGPEGYELMVTPESVLIRAPAEAGLFYGVETLLQLMPPEAYGSKLATNVQWEVPCVEIKDRPRFKWRGLMLDVSRHFFTKQEVEQLLDAMAMHKLNTFHWHLVDDQGWRIEIKKYPLLTEVGGWRNGIGFKLDPKASTAYGPDSRYGGYYTQDDIREVVRYASVRHITIVPEIEMPGHCDAALAAYPEYSCNGGPYTTDVNGNKYPGVFCAGNDQTYVFLENVLKEVFALFPGKYIHIGGDEVVTKNWANCEKCQARKQAEHMLSDRELQSYFIRRMEKFINANGRTLMGWSEIRKGGLAQNAVVMDWIGGGVEAASAGHDVVMTPAGDCYLPHYQSRDHSKEPRAPGEFLPLSRIYAFDPIPSKLAPEFQSHILGAQGTLWTEFIANLPHAEYMIFPRESAMAEVTWSPKDARNFDDFLRRLAIDQRRLDAMGINYRRNPLDVGE